jgi:hypothetical protein
MTISRMIMWAGYVARIGKLRKLYKIMAVRRTEEED